MAEVRAALVGACGKMGQMIVRRINATEGMKVSAAFDLVNVGKDIGEVCGIGKLDVAVSDPKDLEKVLKESKTDVILDFTVAPATAVNAPIAAKAGVNLIIGTTGLSPEQKKAINDAVVENNVAAVISTNYSIGVGIFFKLCREAAKNLGLDYDVEIIEAHHNQKKDAPSGTALALADSINEGLDNAYEYVYDRSDRVQKRDPKEIGISAVRGGNIPGTHEVIFAGMDEVVELTHLAYSRSIFGKGAISAAKFLAGKSPKFYSMADVIG